MTSILRIAVVVIAVTVSCVDAFSGILLNGYGGGHLYSPTGGVGSSAYEVNFNKLGYGLLVNVNGSAVYLGGMTNEYTMSSKVYEHIDGSHDARSRADLPVSLIGMAAAVNGDVIYMCGGAPASKAIATTLCFKLRPDGSVWKTMALYPEAIAFGSMVVLNGAPYVFGGTRAVGPEDVVLTDKVYRYNETSDTWQAMKSMPVAAAYMGSVALNGSDSQAMLCGGWIMPDGKLATTSTCNVYDADSDSWHEAATLNVGRAYGSLVNSGGQLYCIAGWGQSVYNALKTVEMYHSPTNSWMVLPTQLSFVNHAATAIAYSGLVDDQ